jgi:hypothetical protein
LVDTLGLLLAGVVLAADVSDRAGAALVLAWYRAAYPDLQKRWGDRHYGGALPREVQAP